MLEMLGFAAVVSAVVIVGYAAFGLLRRSLPNSTDEVWEPLEIATASALLGVSLWMAGNWILALTHLFAPPSLFALAALFCAVAVGIVVRQWATLQRVEVDRSTAVQLALLTPLLLWLAFILWRGLVLPPLSHDVLGYHLPKAVMIMRAHGFEFFSAPDSRISSLPANYELLLADVLVMTGADRLTEWIGTTFFLLFLIASAAVAQRWWGRGAHVIPCAVAVATAPVVILHSGADKNDLMVGFLAVCALLWGARWARSGGAVPLILLTTALTTGAGTKPQQAAILVGLAPFLLRRMVVEIRANRSAVRVFGAIAAGAILWFLLTGGASYALNALHDHSPMSVQIAAKTGDPQTGIFQWGDWSNLWEFPPLLLTAPFSRNPNAVWVPWRGEYWFWPHYEIYFSHFGILMSLLVVVSPFTVWVSRRLAHSDRAIERMIYTAAAMVALILTLPVQFQPHGFFGSFPRYLLFLLPAIVAWTIAPAWLRWLHDGSVRARAGVVVLGLLSLLFALTASRFAVRDRFAPLEYALWAARAPGTRAVWFMPNRAASVVDRVAGPADTIAVDGSFDTWIYPAYGAPPTRNVVFIQPAANGRRAIPDQADWVIVDRTRGVLWGNPRLTNMGVYWRYVGRGASTADELAVYDQLLADPRFTLIFRVDATNQAVFWRRRPGIVTPRPPIIRFAAARPRS